MSRIVDLFGDRPTISFEFFPPKTDSASMTLGRTIAELEPLAPSFVSVTYGAGGSTRERTRSVVRWVRRETRITPMAHLTCVGHSKAEVRDILTDYTEAGIENILALGGDPPADGSPVESEFEYASELVELVRETGDFSIGVAAHPELHPRSADRGADRRHLAAKLTLADFGVTQFFFEAEHYLRMVDELAELGCTTPVLPGIMPVTNAGQIKRMAELSGADFPAWLAERVEAADGPDEVRRIGVEAATALCAELLERGAPGLHLYTLNRSTATREIHENLGLTPARA